MSLYYTQWGTADRWSGWQTDIRWVHHTPIELDCRHHFILIIVHIIYVRNMVLGGGLLTYVPIRGNDWNILTNVNTAPHLIHDRKFGHEAVSEDNIACFVFIFFGDYIRKITLTETWLTRTKLVCTTSRHRWELSGNYPYFEKYGNLPLCLET